MTERKLDEFFLLGSNEPAGDPPADWGGVTFVPLGRPSDGGEFGGVVPDAATQDDGSGDAVHDKESAERDFGGGGGEEDAPATAEEPADPLDGGAFAGATHSKTTHSKSSPAGDSANPATSEEEGEEEVLRVQSPPIPPQTFADNRLKVLADIDNVKVFNNGAYHLKYSFEKNGVNPDEPPVRWVPPVEEVELAPRAPDGDDDAGKVYCKSTDGSFGAKKGGVILRYRYEATVSTTGAGLGDVTPDLESAITDSLLPVFFGEECMELIGVERSGTAVVRMGPTWRRNLRGRTEGQGRRRLNKVVGIDSLPEDFPLGGEACAFDDGSLSDAQCVRMEGALTLFFPPNYSIHTLVQGAHITTLRAIQEDMANGNLARSHENLLKLTFLEDSYSLAPTIPQDLDLNAAEKDTKVAADDGANKGGNAGLIAGILVPLILICCLCGCFATWKRRGGRLKDLFPPPGGKNLADDDSDDEKDRGGGHESDDEASTDEESARRSRRRKKLKKEKKTKKQKKKKTKGGSKKSKRTVSDIDSEEDRSQLDSVFEASSNFEASNQGFDDHSFAASEDSASAASSERSSVAPSVNAGDPLRDILEESSDANLMRWRLSSKNGGVSSGSGSIHGSESESEGDGSSARPRRPSQSGRRPSLSGRRPSVTSEGLRRRRRSSLPDLDEEEGNGTTTSSGSGSSDEDSTTSSGSDSSTTSSDGGGTTEDSTTTGSRRTFGNSTSTSTSDDDNNSTTTSTSDTDNGSSTSTTSSDEEEGGDEFDTRADFMSRRRSVRDMQGTSRRARAARGQGGRRRKPKQQSAGNNLVMTGHVDDDCSVMTGMTGATGMHSLSSQATAQMGNKNVPFSVGGGGDDLSVMTGMTGVSASTQKASNMARLPKFGLRNANPSVPSRTYGEF